MRSWYEFPNFILFVLGLAGLVAVCGIGAYKYKSRGAMTTSMFMMQLRVAAQGAVVGCLALGITYSMLRDYVFTKAEAEKEPKYGH